MNETQRRKLNPYCAALIQHLLRSQDLVALGIAPVGTCLSTLTKRFRSTTALLRISHFVGVSESRQLGRVVIWDKAKTFGARPKPHQIVTADYGEHLDFLAKQKADILKQTEAELTAQPILEGPSGSPTSAQPFLETPPSEATKLSARKREEVAMRSYKLGLITKERLSEILAEIAAESNA